MISDPKDLSIYLLFTCMSFGGKHLFKSFTILSSDLDNGVTQWRKDSFFNKWLRKLDTHLQKNDIGP